MALQNARAAYLLYTHGVLASYTRYLEDSEKFGWKEDPITAYKKIVMREAGYECFYCAAFTPENGLGQQSQMGSLGSTPQSTSESMGGEEPIPQVTCPQCSRGLSAINYREPEYGDVPVEVGSKLVPRGQEVISLHGGLEIRMPPWCQDRIDFPYFGLVHEVHVSSLRATFGARAKGLQGGWGSGPHDTWDRFARLALVEPTVSYYGTSNQNLVTFKRYWLRPSLFYMLDKPLGDKSGTTESSDDKDIKTLLDIFPDGAYIAFCDSTKLLDARNERMDDHIRICRAVEGAGAYTPSMGSSTISVQKRFNTVQNFIMEWIEYSAAGAGTFFNANVINYKAMKNHRRAPGQFYPLKMAVNQPMSNVLYEAKPGQIAGEVFRYGDELYSQAQQLSGSVPTVSGGTEMSLKPTTYLSDKESALGRLFTAWLHLRMFWAETMCLAVKEFSRWRTADEQYTAQGPDGVAQGRIIRLADLDGNFDAYPEANEQFPVLWQDMRSTFMELVTASAQDEHIGEIVSDLDNSKFAKSVLGLPDLYVPGEDDRLKQKHEIALLLQTQPTQVMDPVTGQPKWLPSLGIDWEDNDAVHLATIKKWAVSSDGLKAKVENPMGYKNVIAHGMLHEAKMQALLSNAAAQGGGDGGQNGGAGGGSPARGVRPGPGAGAGGGKGAAGGKGKEGGGGGKSSDSTKSAGEGPIAQTQAIKSKMQGQV